MFWDSLDQSGGPESCWPWQGSTFTGGYGRTSPTKGETATHRIAWVLTNGPIPSGLLVRHSCDNPPCCNPAHLLLGTYLDNLNDARARGRWKGKRLAVRCPKGHPYTPENTYERTYRGHLNRYCRSCRLLRSRARYATHYKPRADPR